MNMTTRETFDKWHDETYGVKPSFNRDHEGSSHWGGDKQDRYEGWQAALSQPNEPVAQVAQESFGRGNVFWYKECPPDGTDLYIAPPNLEDKIAELEADIIEYNRLMSEDDAKIIKQKAQIAELTAKCKQMQEALENLIVTKKYKEVNGKNEFYETMRKGAWKSAEQALKECK